MPLANLRQHLLATLIPAEPSMPADLQQHAAVLVLLCDAAEPYTVLTQRSMQLPAHPGQISFPGGRIDSSDTSLEHTALRETHEEIGLPPHHVQVLGRLPTVQVASTGMVITPVIAHCAKVPHLAMNPAEVDQLIYLPLRLALDSSQYRQDSLERNGQRRSFHYLQFREHYIWGATARILLTLAEQAQH